MFAALLSWGATTEASPFDATGNAEAYGSSPCSYAQGRDGVSEKLRAWIRFDARGNLKTVVDNTRKVDGGVGAALACGRKFR
jgi:hypothetical protein